MKIPQIILVGPVEDLSGLGETTRNIANALFNMGLKVKIVPTQEAGKAKVTLPYEVHEKFSFLVSREDVQPVSAIHVMNSSAPVLSVNNCQAQFCLSIAETEKCSDVVQFKLVSNGFKENWVSSKYAEKGWKLGVQALANTVKLMTPPVDVDRFSPDKEPLELEGIDRSKDPVVFLMTEEWTKIKNPEIIINSFLKQFKNVNDAYLVIKFIGDPAGQTKTAIKQRIMTERMTTGSNANILLVDKYIDYDLIPNLHKAATYFVSASKLEGWPTAPFQSLSCGVPVIVPKSYSYEDNISSDAALFVKTQGESPINDRNLLVRSQHLRDLTWREPSANSMMVRMKEGYDIYKTNKGAYEKMSRAARENALRHSFNNFAGKVTIEIGKYFN